MDIINNPDLWTIGVLGIGAIIGWCSYLLADLTEAYAKKIRERKENKTEGKK